MDKEKEKELIQKHLRLLRETFLWTEGQLADKLGVARQSVNRMIRLKTITDQVYKALEYMFYVEYSSNRYGTYRKKLIKCVFEVFVNNYDKYSDNCRKRIEGIVTMTAAYWFTSKNKKIADLEIENLLESIFVSEVIYNILTIK